METVVGVVNGDEDNVVAESTLVKQIADPVVYQLVRVDGDGRLVPATDDELMEVEELLEDERSQMLLGDTGQTTGCIPNEEMSSEKPQLDDTSLSRSGNADVDTERINACHEDNDPSLVPTLNNMDTNQSQGVGECLNTPEEPTEIESLDSEFSASVEPDFSKLKGDLYLDNLSIRELRATFKATFGRDTSVKDKLWLKRRIAMGLTNSCDVSTTSFIIKNNKLAKGEEENFQRVDQTLTNDLVVGAENDNRRDSSVSHDPQMVHHQVFSGGAFTAPLVEYDCKNDGLSEHRATKRIRKPTRRYIEELSEVGSWEHNGRFLSAVRSSGQGHSSQKSFLKPFKDGCSDERACVTRLHSLGGSGVHVPYVSRIRRSRPRKNFMALMKFHPSGTAAKLVKKGIIEHTSQPEHKSIDSVLNSGTALTQFEDPKSLPCGMTAKVTKATDDKCNDSILNSGNALKQFEQPHIAAQETDNQGVVELSIAKEEVVEPNYVDSSGNNSDDKKVSVPTAKGGMRRKHHRAWTLGEVMKLVEGVSRYGAGRWSEIKKLAFSSYTYRTSVDLKDKWRNLLRASLAQMPAENGMTSRKNATAPIPAAILIKVRELAELHAQSSPNFGSIKVAGAGGRCLHGRSGYL